MKRNLITKKEFDFVKKYLPAMGRFQIRTDGGAWVEKIDRREAEIIIEIAEGEEYKYLYIDATTTIYDLKEGAREMGIEWRREIEK